MRGDNSQIERGSVHRGVLLTDSCPHAAGGRPAHARLPGSRGDRRCNHHYWSHLNTLKQIGSALLATLLWPLLLLGINLHIH